MAEELYNWIIDVKITANAKSKVDFDILLEAFLAKLQAIKDSGTINYADWKVTRKFEVQEGKVG